MAELLRTFWSTIAQMAPYLLFGFAVAGLLKILIPTGFVRRHLGKRGLAAIVKASIFGVPLPLCSCGVIPVAMSLRTQGAGAGATVAFLISTPQTGVDSILVTLALLGPVFMVIRPIVALISGVIGGAAIDLFGRAEAPGSSKAEDENSQDKTLKSKLLTGINHGFVVLPRDIGSAMLIGLLLAAVISIVLPDDFFAEQIGTGIGAMVIMVFAGIPVYVCATASVPIAAAMIAKGLSPAAGLVFLMTGPATNAATFVTIWKVLGKRVAIIYILTVAACALAAGMVIDIFFTDLGRQIQEHFHKAAVTGFEHISAVVLLLILIFGVYKKLKAAH